jgi:hypothetical protein
MLPSFVSRISRMRSTFREAIGARSGSCICSMQAIPSRFSILLPSIAARNGLLNRVAPTFPRAFGGFRSLPCCNWPLTWHPQPTPRWATATFTHRSTILMPGSRYGRKLAGQRHRAFEVSFCPLTSPRFTIGHLRCAGRSTNRGQNPKYFLKKLYI